MLTSCTIQPKKPTIDRFFCCIISLVICIPALPSVISAQELLTIEQSIHLGMSRVEVNSVLEGRIDIARSKAHQAGIWPNPVVEHVRESTGSGINRTTDSFYSLSQRFDFSGRRGLEQDAARQNVLAKESDAESRRLDLKAKIQRQFFEVLFRQQSLQATRQWSNQMTAVANIVRKREAAGDISGYDRRRLSREQLSAEAKLGIEWATYEYAWERLTALLGDPLLRTKHKEVTGVLQPDVPPAVDQLVDKITSRPDIRSLEQQAEAFELQNRAAGRGWIPEVTLGAGLKTTDNGIRRDSGPMFNVSVPLPFFDRKQSSQMRTSAQARIARSEHGLAISKVHGEVRGLWLQTVKLIQVASEFRKKASSTSEELLRISEAAYQGGEIGVLELIDAYRSSLGAETEALNLEMSARDTEIQLARLTGGYAQ